MNKYIEYVIKYGVYVWGKHKLYRRTVSAERKILATCFCPIGDTLVALPFFRELKKSYPDYELTVIASKQNKGLFESCNFVDKLLEYDDKSRRHHFMSNLKRSYHYAMEYLYPERYEMAFAIEYRMPRIFAAWLLYFSGIKKRICFSERAYQSEHIFHMGSYDRYFTDIYYDTSLVHDVQKNLCLLQFIGGVVKDDSMEVSLMEQDFSTAARLLRNADTEVKDNNMVVILSTSEANRDWPVEKYIALCKKISRQYPEMRYILLGNGSTAEQYAYLFSKEVTESVNLVGKTSIRESMAVMQRCSYYLGGDTGPMHMAYACGLQGVAIYKYPKDLPDGTYDASKTLYPWQSDMQIIQPEHYLYGCECGCYKDISHCINQIAVDDVWHVMEPILKKNSDKVYG